MATFTESEIRVAARGKSGAFKSAAIKLNEEVAAQSGTITYDVFLSHSTRDAEMVLGVKAILEAAGKRVYVDWIEDRQLDRSNVSASTAEVLRQRMRQCRSLIYIHSANSGSSKWMPWELGFSDGLHGAVAIFPVTQVQQEDFHGQEYLGIYPYVDHAALSHTSLRVKRSRTDIREWASWTASPKTFVKTA